MSIEILKRLGICLLLCVVQILVLNNIHLFGVATPLLYVYFVITFRRHFPQWAILVWCFLMGLLIDVFSNTPGLAAGSLTLIGLLQPYFVELFLPRDAADEMEVSMASLGTSKYITLVSLLLLIFCLVFFALEAFSFFNWTHWLLCSFSSALLTLGLIMAIESTRQIS